MHIHAGSYDDFKKLIGVATVKKPAPKVEPPSSGPDALVSMPSHEKTEAPAKVGKALSGTVYYWGGSPQSGDWGCCLVSDDQRLVVNSGGVAPPPLPPGMMLAPGSAPLPSSIAPPTFADDFPDAVSLDSRISVTG